MYQKNFGSFTASSWYLSGVTSRFQNEVLRWSSKCTHSHTFLYRETNRLRGVHFGESQLFKIYGFSSITLAFLPPFWGFSEYGTVTSKAIPEILTSKSSNPLHGPGDFRKFDMFAKCSPKQTENKFTFQDLAQHFLMKAGEEVSGFCKNETQLIT